MEGKVQASGSLRKRGRPVGKGRVPLSLEERRARNAQYERERRIEYAEAMAELAAAAGCAPEITNADLIATVVDLFHRSSQIDPSDNVDALRKSNQLLLQQIQSIEHRMATDPNLADLTIPDSDDENIIRSHTNAKGSKKRKLEPSAIDDHSSMPAGYTNPRTNPYVPAPKRGKKKPPKTEVSWHHQSAEMTPVPQYQVPVTYMPGYYPGPGYQPFPDYAASSASSSSGYNSDVSQQGAPPASLPAADAEFQVETHGVFDDIRQWSLEDMLKEYQL